MKRLLETCDLSFYRIQRCLLKDININLSEGQLLQVQGPNGAGKTTLLKILAGVLEPTEGSVVRDASAICYLGHQLAIKDNLTVQENLEVFCDLAAVSRDKIKPILAELQLELLADQIALELSAGQKKRLSLARLVLQPAELWLLDEPLSSLDKAGIDWFHQLLAEFLAAQGGVILSSHQPVDFLGDGQQCLNLS